MVPSLLMQSSTAGSRPPRYPELDGLRGIAILMVVAYHYDLAPFLSGVDLFFVLSGFLLGGILLDKQEAPNYFKAFYARRFCRILPLYFVCLLVFLILLPLTLGWLFGDPFEMLLGDPLPLWSYFTFTHNFAMAQLGGWGTLWLGHTWSLAVEEQFYLFLPFFIRSFSREKLPYLLIGLILSAPLLRAFLYEFHPHGDLAFYVLMPCRADALLLGVLCAYTIRNERCLNLLRTHTKALYGVLALLLAAGAALMALSSPTVHVPLVAASYGYSWLPLVYSCFVLIAVTEKRGLVTLATRVRPLSWLAVLAFGVFLLHMPILIIFQRLTSVGLLPQVGSHYIIPLGAFLLTLMLASISWMFFERRIVAWGRSFKYGDATR
ncbi:MAG TPA: acyltransferase [Rubrobacteraceae bacterium]|nr:acyltransferase [Rubrobacteraceae bacterium]